ncbi:MAG: 5'-methylthioadenosine/adenosylhomocysteine nucleosidase [Ruminococcus sp.]|jgi:adenosylhomocysteine nucleosidase|nr:5'-methylthioadenosine/adenosylhomocysteine nucleosidase [Ruminococcus sp.]
MIGIICALKIEVEGLKELMENPEVMKKAGLEFISGKIFDKDVVLLECGIGKVNAAIGTQIMIDSFSPDVIINSGIAGSLSKDLVVGDMVISKDCVEHDINCTALDEPRGQISFTDEKRIDIPADKDTYEKLAECCKNLGAHVRLGRIATGDMFVSYVSQRENIAYEFGALCCEMEGGAVGHVCYRNNVPFAILRSISDDLKFNKAVDYDQFSQLAADRTIKALKKFIQLD